MADSYRVVIQLEVTGSVPGRWAPVDTRVVGRPTSDPGYAKDQVNVAIVACDSALGMLAAGMEAEAPAS